MEKVILLKSVLKSQQLMEQDIRGRIEKISDYFPELEFPIYVGILTYNNYIIATANPENNIIFLNKNKFISNVTLAHELAHLAIHTIRRIIKQGRIPEESHRFRRDIPYSPIPSTTEKYASIFAIAHLPPNLIDDSEIPYVGILNIPTDKYPHACKEVLNFRVHNRNYISFLQTKYTHKYPKKIKSKNIFNMLL